MSLKFKEVRYRRHIRLNYGLILIPFKTSYCLNV